MSVRLSCVCNKAYLRISIQFYSNCGMYHCVGVTTVDVRVCGSPGRDKDRREGKLPSSPATMKEGASRKRSTRDSTDTGE